MCNDVGTRVFLRQAICVQTDPQCSQNCRSRQTAVQITYLDSFKTLDVVGLLPATDYVCLSLVAVHADGVPCGTCVNVTTTKQEDYGTSCPAYKWRIFELGIKVFRKNIIWDHFRQFFLIFLGKFPKNMGK